MPTELNSIPRAWAGNVVVSGKSASGTLRASHAGAVIPTVPTAAGTTEVLLLAPATGNVTEVRVAFKDALTADNTNFATFAMVNKGQAGAGTNTVLASTPANTNTTKATAPGAALVAYGQRVLTLSATAANLAVVAGDVLALQITGAGTLGNTLTEGVVRVVVDALG